MKPFYVNRGKNTTFNPKTDTTIEAETAELAAKKYIAGKFTPKDGEAIQVTVFAVPTAIHLTLKCHVDMEVVI